MRLYIQPGGTGGKGEFLKRMIPHLKDLGVRVTRRQQDPHDLALYSTRREGPFIGKTVIRMDGVCHNDQVDWKAYNIPYQKAIAAADGVIYQSGYTQELCDRFLGKATCKTAVILNGADPKFYRALGKATSAFRHNFVCSAKWRSHKRLRDTMLAFLKADIDDSCLWVAGDITDSGITLSDKKLQDAFVQYGLDNKNIEFLGHVDQETLGSYLNLCDAFIHLCSHDACPNSAVEAVCAGTPVITNNVGGTQEIVRPSGGIICDVDKPWDFKAFDLFNQPPIHHRPVVEALRKVVRQKKQRISCDHVDVKNIAAQYKAFFDSVLSGSEPLRPRRKKAKLDIAHVCENYLNLTETFIYGYLSHAQRSEPVVVTDVLQNRAHFPIACSYLFKKSEMSFARDGLKVFEYPDCFGPSMKERGIRLLHAHFGPAGYRTLGLKRRLGVPLVTSFYGYDASCLLQIPDWQQAYRRLFAQGDLFLALGSDMVRRLIAAGCPEEKIRVVHLGVDTKRIRFRRRKWPKGQDSVILLYCGRLVEKKGILDALEAYVALAQRWENLVFRIVGDGPFLPEIEKMVRALNLGGKIVLRGAVSHDEALDEMQNAHLFVLPSLTASDGNMEGTPTVLMEAQASGLPVVSTFHADIPEVVVQGKTGFLINEKDCRALEGCLDGLLKQPDLWADMGRAGRCHVEAHYNIDTEVKKLETIYEHLVR